MAVALLAPERWRVISTALCLALGMAVLTGCGGGDDEEESALAPGSGPSQAPPGPVNVRPISPLPPIIVGSPRLPAVQNPPVLVRTLADAQPVNRQADGYTCRQLANGVSNDGLASPGIDPSRELGPRQLMLEGEVDGIDPSGAAVRVLGQWVRLDSQTLYAEGSQGALAADKFVSIKGEITDDGAILATQVTLVANSDGIGCAAGVVSAVEPTTQHLSLGILSVHYAPSPANLATLKVGTPMAALGTEHAQGALVAEELVRLPRPNALVEGPITALDAAGARLAVLGVLVEVDQTTAIYSAPWPETPLTLSSLRVGDWVRVAAWTQPTPARATHVVLSASPSGSEQAHIAGPATFDVDHLEVLGTALVIDGTTAFRLDGELVSAEAFFSAAGSTAQVSAQGVYTGAALQVSALSAQGR